MEPDLSVSLGRLRLANPVMPASGTFGFGEEYASYLDLNCLGAIVTKSITLDPTLGNPAPRLVETPAGLLNSIGLANPGLDVFLKEKLPWLRTWRPPLIVSIAGKTVDEYVKLAATLDRADGVKGLEINISCPNIQEGGLSFGRRPETAAPLVKAVRQATGLVLSVKLPPTGEIVELAQAVEQAGADVLALINTLPGMAVDIYARRARLGAITGGLSGPAIKPVALYHVWQVRRAVRIPVIGMGGIGSAVDALEFIFAGATAVAVGTANFVSPQVMPQIITGLRSYLQENHLFSLADLSGTLEA